jgi:hypothetical protein
MALYKYVQVLECNNDQAFDSLSRPGVVTPHSGIYRCQGCGHEIASNHGKPLPPQNHHQHINGSPILWRLTVATQS